MSSSSTSARLSWIDTVKGITILLVALRHAAGMAAMKPWSGEELGNFSDAMKTIRMPLFFAMSGFFFLRRANRTWEWFLRNRTGPLLRLFTIWTFLWAAVFLVVPWQRDVDYDIHDALRLFVDPGVGPWFIFALALYFTAMKCSIRFQPGYSFSSVVLYPTPSAAVSYTSSSGPGKAC